MKSHIGYKLPFKKKNKNQTVTFVSTSLEQIAVNKGSSQI